MNGIGMVPVFCHTNLDISRSEVWPTALPGAPQIGSRIRSSMQWREERDPLELEVVGTSWRYRQISTAGGLHDQWHLDIELHLPPHRFDNVTHFELWYEHLIGRTSQETYIRRDTERRERARQEAEKARQQAFEDEVRASKMRDVILEGLRAEGNLGTITAAIDAFELIKGAAWNVSGDAADLVEIRRRVAAVVEKLKHVRAGV